MKEIDELELPGDVRYSATHEWARMSGDTVRVGISAYAQDRLGDITFVEIPQVGASFAQGERCGTLESAKALSELFMPVSGEVVAVNSSLEESPELINQEPYAGGWIIDVKPGNPAEWEILMTSDAYRKMLEGLE
ncbi:MAG: glycine cleavage system protein GcvH [Desulfomonile tiedjei]|nr:glycine cleavage system protein GcvH [Desulfomonile tiedjei]